uniref:rho guanine nucleotide exchange factor 7-like n=1 Tax=Pristiophorus japonicus TaxID=55135 RepID=UPI00398F8C41
MSAAEQTVTWLIALGVLESPKKTVSDPEAFLRGSLRDGVALCRLLERLVPGSVERIHQEPKSEVECLNNIKEFLKGCGTLRVETFDANDLYQGHNFNKILSSLVALNKVTADIGVGSDSICARHPSHHIKPLDSLAGSHLSLGRTSKNLPGKYRSLDMTDSSNHHMVVKAKFNFYQTNEDELCFTKGDVIHVTRVEEGGWWEGTVNGRNGWFPSNYVREIKSNEKPISPKSATLKSSPKGFEAPPISKSYYNVVMGLDNILAVVLKTCAPKLAVPVARLFQYIYNTGIYPTMWKTGQKERGNEVITAVAAEDVTDIPTPDVQEVLSRQISRLLDRERRECVGGIRHVVVGRARPASCWECAPPEVFGGPASASSVGPARPARSLRCPFAIRSAAAILERNIVGLLKSVPRTVVFQDVILITGPDTAKHLHNLKVVLSRLDRSQCQEVRKKKELELQILTEPVHGWEGEDIRSLGNVIYMSQVMVQCGNEDKCERYFLLFPHVLLMLSASPRMSAFIYQGKLPLTGLTITKLEDTDGDKNTFEITGNMIERILVSCLSHQDLQEWVDHLQKQTKAPSVGIALVRQQSVPCHTLPLHPMTPINKHSDGYSISVTPSYHTLPHPSLHGTSHSSLSWGPLEPPKMPKPWSLSCLRPAAPLKPSAALCYKEDLSKSPKTMKKLLPKRKPERKPSDEEFALRKSTAALEEDTQILKVIEAYCTSAKTRQTLNSTWQGTDLMHNHVLSDDDLSSLDSSARRSSLSRLEPADLSEDSDYDSIWLAHSYRMGSTTRKSCCSTPVRRSRKMRTTEDQTSAAAPAYRKESAPQVLLPEEEKMIVEETNSNGQTIIEERSLVDTVYALKDEVRELKQENKKMRRSLEEEQRARKELEKLVRKVLKNMNDFCWDETNF